MQWNMPIPVMLLKTIELPDFVLVNFSVIAVEQVSANNKQQIAKFKFFRCTQQAGGMNLQ